MILEKRVRKKGVKPLNTEKQVNGPFVRQSEGLCSEY
jgi:hypothetical protein